MNPTLNVPRFLEVRLTMTVRSEATRRRVLVIDDNPTVHEDLRKILGPDSDGSDGLAASGLALLVDSGRAESASAVTSEFDIESAFRAEDGIAMVERARGIHRPYAVAFVAARGSSGLGGIETIAGLWKVDPDILAILCIANGDYSWQQIRRGLPHPERLVILKMPFDALEVRQLVASLAEKWRLARIEGERLDLLEGIISDALAVSRVAAQPTRRDSSGKQSGRVADRRAAIQHALKGALQAEQMFLHYQPLVDITTRCAVGLEALLRWRHPDLGLVSPGEFIPIAEETGLIVPIGEFVLRSVCTQLVLWERAEVPVVPIAVNVSAVQLKSPGIWDRMRKILLEEGARPEHLALELTESTLMENAAQHRTALQALRADGIAIEIDDFGTGYSSLSCLKHLPLDTIKIDRSFVTHLETSGTDQAIVGAILAMTHALGLRAVAEGVETAAQLEVLGRHGCEIAQGNYFSPPVAAAECDSLLVGLASRGAFRETCRLRKRPTKCRRARLLR